MAVPWYIPECDKIRNEFFRMLHYPLEVNFDENRGENGQCKK